MKHIPMVSGGLGSWMTAKRVAERHGTDDLILCFADVKGNNPSPHAGEDEDAYRFIVESSADVFGVTLPDIYTATPDATQRAIARVAEFTAEFPTLIEDPEAAVRAYALYLHRRDVAAEYLAGKLVWLNEGRDIWQVFKDDRYLGNSRLANCSKFLKQRPCRAWLDANCDPAETTVYVGIDWTESHRLPSIEKAYLPYAAEAPLTEAPYLDKDDVQAACIEAGMAVPRLYKAGFPHNNCGGFCVRSGMAMHEQLLREHPERYRYHERREEVLRQYLDKDVAVIRSRAGGKVTPVTLHRFRQEIESPAQGALFELDPLDFGGCGCFVEPEPSEAVTAELKAAS